MDHEANRERVKAALGVEAAFGMEYWRIPSKEATCGTIACIGGTAELLMKQEPNADAGYIWHKVGEWMGLSLEVADELFYGYHGVHEDVTIEQACQAIDNAAEFGDPKWEEVRNGS